MNGLLVVDKPAGKTSRDIVDAVEKIFPRKTKLGHTGTLDPLATGILVVCVGKATRLVEFVQNMPKSYRSRFLLGATSDTDDRDGRITSVANAVIPSDEAMRTCLSEMVGVIDQVPPDYSAVKLGGKRAHKLARKGRDLPLTPRPVRIEAIRVLNYEWPYVEVEIDCGKGTYIRSVARDVGEKLGCGGLVDSLRRTRIGPYSAEVAVAPDAPRDTARMKLQSLATVVGGMPRVEFAEDEWTKFRQGIAAYPLVKAAGETGTMVAILHASGDLLAIGSTLPDGRIKPEIVLERW